MASLLQYRLFHNGEPATPPFKAAEFATTAAGGHGAAAAAFDEKVAWPVVEHFEQATATATKADLRERFVLPKWHRYDKDPHRCLYYNPNPVHVTLQLRNGADPVCDITLPAVEIVTTYHYDGGTWFTALFPPISNLPQPIGSEQLPARIDADDLRERLAAAIRAYERTDSAGDIRMELQRTEYPGDRLTRAAYCITVVLHYLRRILPHWWFPLACPIFLFLAERGWAWLIDPAYVPEPAARVFSLWFAVLIPLWTIRGIYRGARRLLGMPNSRWYRSEWGGIKFWKW